MLLIGGYVPWSGSVLRWCAVNASDRVLVELAAYSQDLPLRQALAGRIASNQLGRASLVRVAGLAAEQPGLLDWPVLVVALSTTAEASRAFADAALIRQSNRDRVWDHQVGDLFESAVERGLVSPEQVEAYVVGAWRPRLWVQTLGDVPESASVPIVDSGEVRLGQGSFLTVKIEMCETAGVPPSSQFVRSSDALPRLVGRTRALVADRPTVATLTVTWTRGGFAGASGDEFRTTLSEVPVDVHRSLRSIKDTVGSPLTAALFSQLYVRAPERHATVLESVQISSPAPPLDALWCEPMQLYRDTGLPDRPLAATYDGVMIFQIEVARGKSIVPAGRISLSRICATVIDGEVDAGRLRPSSWPHRSPTPDIGLEADDVVMCRVIGAATSRDRWYAATSDVPVVRLRVQP